MCAWPPSSVENQITFIIILKVYILNRFHGQISVQINCVCKMSEITEHSLSMNI